MRLRLSLRALALLGCAACTGTPQTDPINYKGAPPSLDGSLIGRGMPKRSSSPPVEIVGQPDSAPLPGAVVRVVDLDGTDPPVDASVEADGSFRLVIGAEEGDVLRFVLLDGDSRSLPLDLVLESESLEPLAAALECWSTDPELTLELGYPRGSFIVINGCDQPISLARLALRANHPAFSVTDPPSRVPSGATAQVTVEYSPAGGASEEEVLLIEIDEPTADRRAITLVGEPEESDR